MPFYAYDTNDLNGDRVHIDSWLVSRHTRGEPFCKVCQNELNPLNNYQKFNKMDSIF